MKKTVGVCGYSATGSSAFSDFLREFEETKVLDNIEFRLTHLPDGLEDLEYHLKNYHIIYTRIVAINRFRKFIKKFTFHHATEKEIYRAVNDFLKKIVNLSWNGSGYFIDMYVCSLLYKYLYKLARKFRLYKNKNINKFFTYNMELSVMPENFDEASRIFVIDIINAINKNQDNEEKLITVLDQPFYACNPVKSFKYFENPLAIIIDRDPRDHYLFAKNFLRPRGMRFIPCDNVDDYIKYFRLMRQSSPDLRDRKDIIFFNFEELVYDFENTAKKIADFVGVTRHFHKGEYFKPTHSRNNTQLYKKYSGFESDIKKIERELPEYLFHFENYPDIDAEGGMFWGSQNRKRQ